MLMTTPETDPHADALQLAEAIRSRQLSPLELVEATLARIASYNPLLNAYLTVFEEEARRAALRAEREVMAGREPGPLHGVPVSVKDLIETVEGLTSGGSRLYGPGIWSGRDALAVRRLRRAGAIVLGKTNLHELAYGVTTVNEHFGPARNPYDRERMAGGSSGGSAVAVAAGLGPLSLGTDTRGSIRIPAACCGITGFKPTQRLVLELNRGVIPLSRTLDHVGPMARSAAECAVMLEAMVRGWQRPPAWPEVQGLRLGVDEYYLRDLDSEVQGALEEGLAVLRALGCKVREVKMPELDSALQSSGVIASVEALAEHLERMREAPPDAIGPRVRQRLEKGAEYSGVAYLQALRDRVLVAKSFDEVFGKVDCLVGAVVPVPAPPLDTVTLRAGQGEQGIVDAFTRCNAPQNMAGVPALAMPCGRSSTGLPLGWQIVGPGGRDDLVLGLGIAYQKETDWHRCRPGLP
jgi:aspartyl-tRNA(Asn)/glutamyl-tRNA(Gln) amidotransferase subunit A